MRKSTVIHEISLRGVGSYLHGQRLKIRPLTVLCGPNGSGKSTWIQVLDLLCEMDGGTILRFSGNKTDNDRFREMANAVLDSHRLDEVDDVNKPDYEETIKKIEAHKDANSLSCGPLGTVGLLIDVVRSIFPQHPKYARNSSAEELPTLNSFLLHGHCIQGDQIHLSITRPEWSPKGIGQVRLSWKGEEVVRFDKPSGHNEYTVHVPLCLALDSMESTDPVAVATISARQGTETQAIVGLSDYGEAHANRLIAERCVDLIQRILADAVSGTFHLGAIRREASLADAPDCDPEGRDDDRFVGKDGSRIHNVFKEKWSNLLVQAPTEPGSPIDESQRSLHPLYWKTVDGFLRTHANLKAYFDHGVPSLISRQDFSYDSVLRLLTTVKDRSGFSAELRSLCGSETSENEIGETTDDDEEIIAHARRFLREEGFLLEPEPCLYNFGLFYGRWMKFLLDTHPNPHGSDSSSFDWSWKNLKAKPVGNFVVELDEEEEKLYFPIESSGLEHARYFHECFFPSGRATGVERLSSGFHQVAPIVLQSGLLRKNELLCLENPEVHLHPKLQSKLTDFLIAHANAGRRFIIETHSDIVIYRVLNAMISENIAQGYANIAFISLKPEGGILETRYSSIEPMKVDEHGRIANWPKGFLDEGAIEAKRLLDLMYGNINSDRDDEELE